VQAAGTLNLPVSFRMNPGCAVLVLSTLSFSVVGAAGKASCLPVTCLKII
jgi:hypothetical protein